MPPKQYIVKVQVSISTSAAHPQILIYNEDRSIEWSGDAIKSILKEMGGELKRFYFATTTDDGNIVLLNRAPWQNW